MRLVRDRSWVKRGISLLWGGSTFGEIAQVGEVVSMRELFAIAHQWPEGLPSAGGDSLVVAGLDGCLDSLSPEDAETWIERELYPRVRSFQDEYEGQAGLVLWIPGGRQRVRMETADGHYLWHCAAPHAKSKIPLGKLLWGGAEGDVGRLMETREKDQSADGPAWIGLHLARIS